MKQVIHAVGYMRRHGTSKTGNQYDIRNIQYLAPIVPKTTAANEYTGKGFTLMEMSYELQATESLKQIDYPADIEVEIDAVMVEGRPRTSVVGVRVVDRQKGLKAATKNA